MPRFSQLSDWLAWLETLHPQAIDLGLSRIYQVACQLKLLQPPSHISHEFSGELVSSTRCVMSVAGTNGKGSCVKTMEQCLLAQGHTIGTYTSPHLHSYNERIHINGEPVSDALICEAFSAIDSARKTVSLTYFEFATLAALWIFVKLDIPYVILEVGLGGRLDAVNIVDADISIVTSIAVDHEEWLGSDRNQIAIEKLGISRQQRPVIITETDLTPSLINFTNEASLSQTLGTDFSVKVLNKQLYWQPSAQDSVTVLTIPVLPVNSVVAGLQALFTVKLLPDESVLQKVLAGLALAGRYQLSSFKGRQLVFDVAHNPAASAELAKKIYETGAQYHKTLAVFTGMQDKDMAAIIAPLSQSFAHWYCGELLGNERAIGNNVLSQYLIQHEQNHTLSDSIEQSFTLALDQAGEHDRIIVFGSFFTVAAIQHLISESQ